MQKSKTNIKHLKGLLALSPLVLFLLIYLATSIFIGDFYKIPIASAFLIASVYALALQKGKSIEERITVFSQGAGHKNILLMIWIFILAGAFAATAKEIGAIEATVNFTLSILPSNFLFAGLFIASCFISMSIGTSVGTIVALAPIASGIAAETSLSTPFLTAIVVGGSFFGDNLSFISDTTIAATRTQECNMSDKFKANIKIAAPAAFIVAILYIVKGFQTEFITAAQEYNLILLLPYITVIGLAISRINVIVVLTIGLVLNAAIGFSTGVFSIPDFLASVGGGIANMSELITVTLLAGGMLELIKASGGLDYIIDLMTNRIKGKRGAEFSIAALVSLANVCTANNTIAIITTGPIAKDISKKYGVDSRKSASILDTFSCLIQGVIPYGAQMLMASQIAAVSSISILEYLYYPYALGIIATLAIIFRFPKNIS